VAELEQAKEDAENELRVKEDLVNQLESSKQEYVDLQQHQERMADHIRSLEDKVRACVDQQSPHPVASFGGPRPLFIVASFFQVESTEGRVAAKQAELTALQAEFDKYQQDIAQDLDELEGQVDSLTAELKERDEEIKRRDEEILSLQVTLCVSRPPGPPVPLWTTLSLPPTHPRLLCVLPVRTTPPYLPVSEHRRVHVRARRGGRGGGRREDPRAGGQVQRAGGEPGGGSTAPPPPSPSMPSLPSHRMEALSAGLLPGVSDVALLWVRLFVSRRWR